MENLTDNMIVDDYDYPTEKTDVVVVSPPGSEPESAITADDHSAMMAKLLPNTLDLEVEAESVSTWRLSDWRKMERKSHGPIFQCGGYPWRILFYPYGNQVEYVSLYLEHAWENEPTANWYACVQFALVLSNVNDPSIYEPHVANHRFTTEEPDWGFTRFYDLKSAFAVPWEGKNVPLVQNDEATVTAYVRVVKDPTGVLWHNFRDYDSKKETGMVGLRNQGATCYLNSLLQSLYFTNAFRKAVYQIPTEQEARTENSAWALQRLFYNLQTNEAAVSTAELTKSFGWQSSQIFEQQDVQELSRKLMERLEHKMKGTVAEKVLPDLFVGKSKTYISCINVDYESSRVEDFWDIQLNVRGNKTLDDSFKDYIQVETLEGENKYEAGAPYGLQDAKKGVIFESFPPVLHLHLKRFEYDINCGMMAKVNDLHAFPMEFDAAPYLSEGADRSESWVYQLHGVLVHSGTLDAGHYYAFLKPTKDGHWYRFDDDRVNRATDKEVLDDNYGEGQQRTNGYGGRPNPRKNNAYMLVYVRKTRQDDVLLPVTEEDVPSHIEKRLSEDRAEMLRRNKERDEAHLYMNVGVLDEDTFKNHDGFDLTSPNVPAEDQAENHTLPKQYKVLRAKKISEFAQEIAEQRGVKPEAIQFWAMVGRQNKTTRPDQIIRNQEMTLGEAQHKFSNKGHPFRLWLELAPTDVDGQPAPPPDSDSILIFLKCFDVALQTLTGVCSVYVRKNQKVSDLATIILPKMDWPAGTDLQLFEEIKPRRIDLMKPKKTFQESEIQDGDIITFQRSLKDSEVPASALYTNAPDFYTYLLNRMDVTFAPIKTNEGEKFTLTLSREMSYDQFAKKVGEHLQVDATHLRFAPVMEKTGKAKAFLKRTVGQDLFHILTGQYGAYGYTVHRPDALYYEVLDMSLSDYESKKCFKVTWLPDGVSKEENVEVLISPNGTVVDLLSALQEKLALGEESIRIAEASGGKNYKELPVDFNVAAITANATLYAEKVPDEELHKEPEDRVICAFSFDREPGLAHGIPFKFVVKPGERFAETKKRLSTRTQIKGKSFEKIKFTVVPRVVLSSPKPLEDDDILFDLSGPEDRLGLDHANFKNRSFWGRSDGFSIR